MITAKISSAFRNLLDSRKPEDLVKVVLVLDVSALTNGESSATQPRRMTAKERKTKSSRVKSATSSTEVKSTIEKLLNRHQATQMSQELSALGTLLVEAPTASVLEFEQEPLVRAILENQSIAIPSVTANR